MRRKHQDLEKKAEACPTWRGCHPVVREDCLEWDWAPPGSQGGKCGIILGPYSVPLVHMSILLMPMSCRFDYHFEIGKCEYSNFVLLFQACFGYLEPFTIPYEI